VLASAPGEFGSLQPGIRSAAAVPGLPARLHTPADEPTDCRSSELSIIAGFWFSICSNILTKRVVLASLAAFVGSPGPQHPIPNSWICLAFLWLMILQQSRSAQGWWVRLPNRGTGVLCCVRG
jgi:hypothetical protein